MSGPTFRLEADGLTPLDLSCGEIAVSRFDLGDAAIRVVAEDAPDTDGSIDTSTLMGPRVVTIEALIRPHRGTSTRWALTQQLKAFTHPRLRPILYYKPSDDDPELMLTMRRSQFADFLAPQVTPQTTVTMQWVVPSGILESAELFTATAAASGDPAELGFMFDLTFDLTFPAMDPQGSVQVVNAGDRDAYPLLRLYGPFSGLTSISNDTVGKALVFDDHPTLGAFAVTAGNFLEIDMRTKTIRLNGDPTQTRNQYLVFPDSAWWSLQPGEQRIRLEAETFTSPAQVQVSWRDAYS